MGNQSWLLVAFSMVVMLASLAAASDVILLPPLNGKTGPSKLLVFIPGGKVPNVHYNDTAIAIQEASKLQLWVVIPACLLDLCLPVFTTTSSINSALTQAQKASGLGMADTFIAGHSLGGVAARYYVDNEYSSSKPFAGSLLFGTNYPAQLDTPKLPQFELAGELDMVSVAQMAPAYSAFAEQYKADEVGALRSGAPVLVVPGADHSDFCPGFFVEGDIPSELTPAAASAAFGSLAGAWLDLVVNAGDTAALAVLRAGVQATEELLRPAADLHELEKERWCETAQLILSGLSAPQQQLLQVTASEVSSTFYLMHTHPNYTRTADGQLLLTVPAYPAYAAGSYPSTTKTYAQDLACKCTSYDRIAEQLGLPLPSSPPSCADVNRAALKLAASVASPRVLARYARAHQLAVGVDEPTPGSIGPDWVFLEHLDEKVAANGDKTVASPALLSLMDSSIYPGNHYCKVLSPETALAWLMTDSLLGM